MCGAPSDDRANGGYINVLFTGDGCDFGSILFILFIYSVFKIVLMSYSRVMSVVLVLLYLCYLSILCLKLTCI